jgi:hypothetical protein
MPARTEITAAQDTDHAGIAIRLVEADTDGALAKVAARDSSELPRGPWLVAEVAGEPLAALSLATGELVADPFSRTTELRALLELRAMQLRTRAGRRRRRDGHRPRPRPRARAALAGSPPGAGGRLLTLLARE